MKNKLLLLLVLIVPIITFGQETAKKGLDERINDWFEPITAKQLIVPPWGPFACCHCAIVICEIKIKNRKNTVENFIKPPTD